MKFEWDEAKANSNYSKHGVLFQEATTCSVIPLPEPFQIRIILIKKAGG